MKTWDEMRADLARAEQLRLARLDVVKMFPRQLQKMHERHGATDGKRCGDCAHLIHVRDQEMAAEPFKCELYSFSHCNASDWRLKWPACGRWEQPTGCDALDFKAIQPVGPKQPLDLAVVSGRLSVRSEAIDGRSGNAE